ncbi:MauE/DoxX family redox-associated membrane protein [Parapedobacter lycopersici]|uniref:MauE/DoxX family redox-associated membrane protein n=1 Tax=Parapedobacter lycopersici TaxID=1864939 RepID=UPI00214DB24E|nr:MauE/DoxX family redox-associated membrane protein [Parapedobacter lycopersici]
MNTLQHSGNLPRSRRRVALEVIVFLCVLLFVYAAVSKLMIYEYTTAQLKLAPLTAPIAGFVAWAVPACELLIATMLCFSRWRQAGLYAFLGLMALFTIYIVQTLFFSERLPCSCGGVIGLLSWSEHLLFNIGFMLLAVAGILLQRRFNFHSTGKEVTGNK